MSCSLFAMYAAGILGLASCAADADVFRYDFDGTLAAGEQGGTYVDGERFDGQVRIHGDARIEVVAGHGGSGNALRFPEPCEGPTCPQVIVEIPDDDALDPGNAPFSYGAAVLVESSELTGGSNIVQKGFYSDTAGQWKLQVDKEDGRPGCVVQGQRQGTHTRARVVASVGVADGQWHTVTCYKRDGYVAIEVDGEERGRESVRVGSASNDAPVRIGGKGILDEGGNDQYHGVLDDVFFRVDTG